MKQIFKALVLVAAAVATLTSCEKAPEVSPAPEEFTLTVNATLPAPDGTKTYLGDKVGNAYPVLWSEDDRIRVSQVPYIFSDGTYETVGAGSTSTQTETITSRSADNTSATIDFTFTAPNQAANYIDYVAVNGSGQYQTITKRNNGAYWPIALPMAQAPTEAGQFDRNAIIIGAKSLGHVAVANTLYLNFQHLPAYAIMSLTNLNCGDGEKIQSVTFESAEHVLAGSARWSYLEDEDNYTSDGGTVSNSIIVDMSGFEVDNGNFDVCFSAFPTAFAVNETISVSVTTDADKTYVREIVIPAGKTFNLVQGRIATFSVDMSTAASGETESTKYVLVEDVANLDAGDEVIIVALHPNDSKYYAAGAPVATGNTYLAPVAVPAPETKTISITSETIDSFILEAAEGGFKFKSVGQGKYLGWSSGNKVQYNAAKQTWSVTIVNGTTTITLTADTQRKLQYNKTAGQERFAAYTGTQVNPSIYKKVN